MQPGSLETLESRRMLSAVAAAVVGSTLTVTGTPDNDTIIVSLKGKTLAVKAGGITRKFAARGVKLIKASGGAGHDLIQVDAPIACQLDGGPGDDYLLGASKSDRLYGGAGDDILDGRGGKDALFGASGRDINVGLLGRLNDRSSEDIGPGQFSARQISRLYDTYRRHPSVEPAPPVVSTPPAEPDSPAPTTGTSFGGTLTIGSGTTLPAGVLVNAGTLTLNGNSAVNHNGGGVVVIPGGVLPIHPPNSGSVIQLSDPSTPVVVVNSGATPAPTSTPTLPMETIASYTCLTLMTLPQPGQPAPFLLSGQPSALHGGRLTFTLEIASMDAAMPGTYPLVRFADDAYLPSDISGIAFQGRLLPAQYTHEIVLNPTNRSIDLVIADKPPAATESSCAA